MERDNRIKEREVLSRIIQRQIKILGKEKIEYVKKIPGIELDEEGRVVSISRSFEETVREIIEIFSRFNPIAKTTIITALMFARIQCPEIRIPPEFLKKDLPFQKR